MQVIKTKEASEKQIKAIKYWLWKTQTRLLVDNDELNEIDSYTARCLIKSLKTWRNHPMIHPDCRTERFIDLERMKQSSSEDKPMTSIQEGFLKFLLKEYKITGEQFNGVKNSLDAYNLIKQNFKTEGEVIKLGENMILDSKNSKTKLSDEDKIKIKKLYLEDLVGVPTISKETGIAVHTIYYWLKTEKLMRTMQEYVASGGLKKAMAKAHERLHQMKQTGELKRKPKEITPTSFGEVKNSSMTIMLNGVEVSGNAENIAQILSLIKK